MAQFDGDEGAVKRLCWWIVTGYNFLPILLVTGYRRLGEKTGARTGYLAVYIF